MFADVLTGLNSLHKNNLIHRDIKPNNIFIKNGTCKIGDLGLALKLLNSDDFEGDASVGTALYKSPETSFGMYSDKCDIYSLGIVLFECYKKFYSGMERVVCLQKFREGIVVGNFEDERVLRFAQRMCAERPEDRPNCDQILNDLIVAQLWEKPTYCQLLESTGRMAREIERLKDILDENGINYLA